MDRMPVCGIGDPGSIPGESTIEKSAKAGFSCALAVKPGGLYVRNRSPIELDLSLRKI